jgi:hypothetical protein
MVAVGLLRHPHWYPVGDLAQVELRVRDVGSRHPPLIGMAGRIGSLAERGSHPGPLGFWAMWPLYRLLGETAWAMQVASASLHVVAMAVILWTAHRRGGVPLMLGVAAVLAVLTRGYGPLTLTESWNPFLPVLWWVAFLLAVWSVACDDLALLPVAAFAGSFCLQAHLSYGTLVLGLGGLTAGAGLLGAYRRRRDQRAMLHVARCVVAAAVVGGLAWLPPLIDQLTNSPGNLSTLWDSSFGAAHTIGARRGLEVLVGHLNPWRLVTGRLATHGWLGTGSLVPGVLLMAAWAVSVELARRLRHSALLRLDLVLGISLLLGVAWTARISGPAILWYWLVLWGWGTCGLMLLATGWTTSAFLARRRDFALGGRAAGVLGVALVMIVVVFSGLFARDAAYVDYSDDLSKRMDMLVPPTIDALDRGSAPGGGRDGRYLVTWTDPLTSGIKAWGLINELDRHGFHVGANERFRAPVTAHRVMSRESATARVHLAIDREIETWRATPGVRQVAYADPRSPSERAEYDRLHSQVVRALQRAGLSELIPRVDDAPGATAFNPRVPAPVVRKLARMLILGLPEAVFVAPPRPFTRR